MARYSDELIDEIRNSNDIVDVISQYVVLKRSGRNFFGLCPFHKEKSPSFSVSPDKQIFHCFGCGVGGNVIHFVSKIENLDFKPTLELLAERSGITLPTLENGEDANRLKLKEKVYQINKFTANYFHENLYKPTAKEAQGYVKKRKLDNNTLKTFSIGFSTNFDELYKALKGQGFTDEEILASSLVSKSQKGQFYDKFKERLMFPIKDVQDRVIAFGGRVLDDSKPKYINSPENIVYSKGRNLFGLNIAKKSGKDKIIIVEGYMDAISLYQRGITNVVASLGTALTEAQGRLLRKYASQVIIGYDADGAGQAATIRGMEILQNLGCDIRILQLDGDAKDPDEYIIKYGSGRFEKCVENAISLVEFKVRTLKNTLKVETASDKIKFLNEIVKILSKVDNNIEREIYIDKISKEYGISKEAIYGEANKASNNNSQGIKVLQRPIGIKHTTKNNNNEEVSEALIKRENMIISLLINPEINSYEQISRKINPEDFKLGVNKKIATILYEHFEKGNSNSDILSLFSEEELINHITSIMADDFEISDNKKAIEDLLNLYEKEKMLDEKTKILKKLENTDTTKEEAIELEKRLSNLIIQIAKMK
ncbi:MAG: DNA primase [Clostridia bacterium]|nr:DNA primase [Clostridia bacterium]